MTVTFSPGFSSEHLPAPAMSLIDTGAPRRIQEDNPIDVADSATLKISVDELINAARNLQQVKATAQTLLEANKALTSAVATRVAAPADNGSAPVPAAAKLISPECCSGSTPCRL